MYECFLEIAYEAELNIKEDAELSEIAREQCCEDPLTRATAVRELREMIYDRDECRPLRTDDQYLLRFLRARDFIVPKAHRLLVRYCNFREEYPELYKGVDLWNLARVKNTYGGVMYDRPDIGRISVIRFGMWDPNEYPIEDMVRVGLAVMEIGIRQPKIQVLGGTMLVDMEGVTLRHMTAMTTTVAYQMVSLLGVAAPTRVRACHILNYSWFLNTLFYVFKKFIPQHFWGKIFFHSDLKSLHKHIDPECLPVRYGGTCRNYGTFEVWLGKIKKYRDQQFDKEMKELGYIIKE